MLRVVVPALLMLGALCGPAGADAWVDEIVAGHRAYLDGKAEDARLRYQAALELARAGRDVAGSWIGAGVPDPQGPRVITPCSKSIWAPDALATAATQLAEAGADPRQRELISLEILACADAGGDRDRAFRTLDEAEARVRTLHGARSPRLLPFLGVRGYLLILERHAQGCLGAQPASSRCRELAGQALATRRQVNEIEAAARRRTKGGG